MSYINGLPYITKTIDKGVLKCHIYGDFEQNRRGIIWIKTCLNLNDFFGSSNYQKVQDNGSK